MQTRNEDTCLLLEVLQVAGCRLQNNNPSTSDEELWDAAVALILSSSNSRRTNSSVPDSDIPCAPPVDHHPQEEKDDEQPPELACLSSPESSPELPISHHRKKAGPTQKNSFNSKPASEGTHRPLSRRSSKRSCSSSSSSTTFHRTPSTKVVAWTEEKVEEVVKDHTVVAVDSHSHPVLGESTVEESCPPLPPSPPSPLPRPATPIPHRNRKGTPDSCGAFAFSPAHRKSFPSLSTPTRSISTPKPHYSGSRLLMVAPLPLRDSTPHQHQARRLVVVPPATTGPHDGVAAHHLVSTPSHACRHRPPLIPMSSESAFACPQSAVRNSSSRHHLQCMVTVSPQTTSRGGRSLLVGGSVPSPGGRTQAYHPSDEFCGGISTNNA